MSLVIPRFPNSESLVRSRRRGIPRPTLRVAAFAGFAPFAWQDHDRPRGRDIAFLERFAGAEGLALAVEFFPFDRLWERPAADGIDLAASGISLRRGSEADGIAWTHPYASVRRTLLIRETDRPHLKSMADLSGRRIAAVAGSAADRHAVAQKPPAAELVSCATLETGITALRAGQVDAVGTGDLSAQHHLAVHPELAAIDVHGGAPPEFVAFAVRRDAPWLPRLNAFIRREAAYW
ncbi:MAG TPA: transporter substrate-binding domain-containing protein [Chthoniobacterales bacterium]|jgi:ABC-type amino acid transport substrate-binding protein